jgi:glycosyltransferase involved in cell wall biosynthesis
LYDQSDRNNGIRVTVSLLYISYDGALEPLGQSQVLCYLQRLGQCHRIILVSFEKVEDWDQAERREALRVQIRQAGIHWIPLRYHRKPSALATAYDIAKGMVVGAWAVLRYRVRIVHARSYVPSVIALVLKKMFGLKYVFDMRGFWADERVDGELWEAGSRLYRVAKWFEQRFLLNADCIVSLTEAAANEMRSFPYLRDHNPRLEIITTCADLETFRPTAPCYTGHPPGQPFTLGYVGSVGTWYLFDEVLRCFKLLCDRVPGARLHILNQGGHDYIHGRLQAMEVDATRVLVESRDALGVAEGMQGMDAGIFFYKPTYSRIATAPTKLGEFLGCGIPCLGNSGVGDVETILGSERVGVTIEGFSTGQLEDGISQLLKLVEDPGITRRCREAAEKHFSLDAGVSAYDRIYRSLGMGDGSR